MAHYQQLQFVKSIATSFQHGFAAKKVIEIGSYDVSGTVRDFFSKADYVGVDLIAGPGVDLVCEGAKVPYEDNSFDLAISCECFEHNPEWAQTFQNMHRLTKNGGLVLFTCATTGRAEHGTTRSSPDSSPGTQALDWDYYQNLTEQDFRALFDFDELFSSCFFMVNEVTCDLYFCGLKGQPHQDFVNGVGELKNICQQDQEDLQKLIAYRKAREKWIPKPLRKFLRRFVEKNFVSTLSPRLVGVR